MSGHEFSVSEAAAPSALLVELLEWITARPRTYSETMEAWRTSCPRMPVWEDAIIGGLVEVLPGNRSGVNGSWVKITPPGQALLAARGGARHVR
jgi:hypothetical protein